VILTAPSILGSDTRDLEPFPVVANGIQILAIRDEGSNVTCVAKELVDELGISYTPASGGIHTISSHIQIPRVGVTEPIHLVSGRFDVMHACEIIDGQRGHMLYIGRDLRDYFRMHALGLPFESIDHRDAAEPAVDDSAPPIADKDFAGEELEPSFVAFCKAFMLLLRDALDANAAVPADAYCPMPESIVHLETPAGKVVNRRQYPIPYKMIKPIGEVIGQWLDDGVIIRAPVGTAFNTPIFAVPKKDLNGQRRYRVCADFRPLNALLPDDSFPLPLINDIFKSLVKAVIFTSLDLKSAYNRFLIALEDRHKTCFTWQDAQYVFARAPFGLKTLPSIFQRVIQIILADMPFARAYIDDVIVFSEDRAEHAGHVRQVVQTLTANNMVLNMDKCHFARLKITLLGFRITPLDRSVDPERVANVSEWPTPTTGKQLQHYLGFSNYFREHMPLMSTLTSSLDSLRQVQDLRPRWTKEHDAAFARLKKALLEALVPLAHPDFELPFCVATDASAAGIGAVLYQQQSASEKPRWISFQARALSKSERNYSATKRELLAIRFALGKFRYYIWGSRFTMYSDHAALTYLHSQSQLNPMLAGWYEDIFEYDFVIVHRPGILNILPDHLSRFYTPPALEGEETQPPREVLLTAVPVHTEDARTESYIVPEPGKRAELLDKHHLLGHFGATTMTRSIRDAGFSWPNIREEALAHCQRCKPCRMHTPHPRAFHMLQSVTAALPFDHVAVDLAGPFPTSSSGNHFLHVLIDVHSRFVLLKAIPDKRMETIAALWLDVFTTFGFPKIIQSDNGSEFVNKVVKAMLSASKVEHRLISPYHPRANGVAERAVQTATRAIKKMLAGIKHTWDVYAPFVQFCINQKISERHQHRPFEVVFGRRANAFSDFADTTIPADFAPSSTEHEQVMAEIKERVKVMQEQLFPEVTRKSQASADKVAKAFNKKHRITDIPINTFVMVRDNLRKSKLEPTNKGPYKVVGKTKGGSYVLEDNEGQLFPHNFPPSALISLSTNPTFEQDSFEVKAILNHQEIDGDLRYLVRWMHHSPEHDSWEPEENFDDHGAIHDYWSRRGQAVVETSKPRRG
jgi:transposase InsO family protein